MKTHTIGWGMVFIFGLLVLEFLFIATLKALRASVNATTKKSKTDTGQSDLKAVVADRTGVGPDRGESILDLAGELFEVLGDDKARLIYISGIVDQEPGKALLLKTSNVVNVLNQPINTWQKDDYRICSVGHFMRKYWIDELPMLINVIKGELKIVGVRPLSKHYFSLYSPELQQLRIKSKPGLVPPFYADMPKTLEEIEASEQRYLEAWQRAPFRTDVKYFFKAFYNILFKRARSH